MAFKDFYQSLGVKRDADAEEIKRAYRRQARKFHPDVSTEPQAEERFKEIQQAWEVLKDPDKRAAYDRYGENWEHGSDFQPPPDWGPDINFGAQGGPRDFSEFFDSLFGEGGLGGMAGQRGGGRRGRGEDLQARVAISLEDAFHGTTRSITLQVPEADASGRAVNRPKTLNVKIPAGVSAGQRIRLSGQGGPGRGGAPAGDLFLEVSLQPHALFRVEGRDVHLDVPIAPWEAALGATITVPTLAGRVDVRVPAGSASGKKLRLKGRGLPGKPAGNGYVHLQIYAPKPETDEQRALYERMARELPFRARERLEAATS